MKTMRFLFILCFFLSTLSMITAEEKKTEATESKEEKDDVVLDYSHFKFVTDKKTEVKIKYLTCGLLRKMGKGERFIQGYTTSKKPIYAQKWHREPPVWGKEVPVIDGYIFGAFIVFAEIPIGEKITIEVVDTPPFEYEVSGVKLKQLKQSYDLTKGHKNYPLITIFKKEDPQLMQYGTWKKEFFNDGKLIFSYTYNLIKPNEEELKLNAVYEDYVAEAQKSLPPAEEETPKEK